MKTSQRGIYLIKRFEGVRLHAYKCPAGVPTIGYGHTVGVRMGQSITLAQAEQLLRDDLPIYEVGVLSFVKQPLTQGQFDALVSFAFNLGVGALGKSTLMRRLNAGDYAGAAGEFGKWVNAGGIRLRGLVLRREAERALFIEP